MNIRHLRAVEGWLWLKASFGLFRAAPVTWSLITLVYGFTVTLIALLPFGVGAALLPVLWPVFTAGIVYSCQRQQAGERLRVAGLFSAFRHPALRKLLRLGSIYLLASTILLLLLLYLNVDLYDLLTQVDKLQDSKDTAALAAANQALVRGLILHLVFFLPLIMASWFAPPLVMLDDQTVADALRLSFKACFFNTIPFLVYGAVLLFLAVLTMMLGLLLVAPLVPSANAVGYSQALQIIFVPITLISNYFCYCRVFERPRSGA